MIATPAAEIETDEMDILAQDVFARFWAKHGRAVRGEAHRLGIAPDQLLDQRLLRVVGNAGLIGLDDLPDLIAATGISMNRGTGNCVFRGVQPVLTVTEYDMLSLLAGNAGQVLTRDFIVAELWDGHSGYSSSVNVHLNRLRGKLNLRPDEPPLLTVRGRGYQWIA